jgi:hypothetical protein
MATKPVSQQSPDSLLMEQSTRHSVMLERLKAGEVKKFEKYLRQIDTVVRDQLTRKELTTYSRQAPGRVPGAQVDGKLLDIYKRLCQRGAGRLWSTSQLYESTFEARSLNQCVHDRRRRAEQRGDPRGRVLLSASGEPGSTAASCLKPSLSGWTRAETMRVTNTIRLGFGQGQTNAQIIQAVRGTAGTELHRWRPRDQQPQRGIGGADRDPACGHHRAHGDAEGEPGRRSRATAGSQRWTARPRSSARDSTAESVSRSARGRFRRRTSTVGHRPQRRSPALDELLLRKAPRAHRSVMSGGGQVDASTDVLHLARNAAGALSGRGPRARYAEGCSATAG